jgi:hypothetical protein
MEETLRLHLATCVAAFERLTGITPQSVGKRALNDNTFFRRVVDQGQGFTVKTYDEVMRWFDENWPEDTDWPGDVPRPEAARAA